MQSSNELEWNHHNAAGRAVHLADTPGLRTECFQSCIAHGLADEALAAFMDALRDARALIAQKPLSIETVDSKVLLMYSVEG